MSSSQLASITLAAAGAILITLHTPAVAQLGASYPPFDRRCSESQIRQYLEDLNDRDRVRFVTLALGLCKTEAASALAKLIQDRDVNTRSLAAYGMGLLNLNRKEAMQVLIASVKDGDVSTRLRTFQALESLNAGEAIPALVEALEDKDATVRNRAALTLVSLGRNPQGLLPVLTLGLNLERTVPVLIAALDDKDEDVRYGAVQALGHLGQSLPAAVQALIASLKSRYANVRSGAAEALGNIGKDAPTVTPALIDALKDEDPAVRRAAVEALGSFGRDASPAVPYLTAIVKETVGESEPEYPLAYFATETLKKIGRAAVPALMLALHNNNAEVRHEAIQALGDLGKDAREAIPVLMPLLRDENIGSIAAWEVGKICKEAPEAIPALVTVALHDKNPTVRSNASYGLQALGEASQPAISPIIAALKSSDRELRSEASKTLGQIGKPSVPALVEALRDRNARTRAGAALAFWHMAEHNPNVIPHDPGITGRAIPALRAALRDSNVVVRYRALLALKELRSNDDSLPHLPIAALADEDESARLRAATDLAGTDSSLTQRIIDILVSSKEGFYKLGYVFNKAGKDAVPILAAYLKHPDSHVRTTAASALGEMRQDAKAAVPALIGALEDADRGVQMSAASALTAVTTDARQTAPVLVPALAKLDDDDTYGIPEIWAGLGKDAVPYLIVALGDRSSKVRRDAALALAQIGKDAKAAVPQLYKALKDDDANVRFGAVQALLKVTDESDIFIPPLIEALKDESEVVRYLAVTMLHTAAPRGVSALLTALHDDSALTRKGAAIALAGVKPLPAEVIRRLTDIVEDERQDLEVRRAAASTLEADGLDMQPFFTKNNLVAPSNAVCPALPYNGGTEYFRFNAYTGQCMDAGYSGPLSGGSSLYDFIKKFFGGK